MKKKLNYSVIIFINVNQRYSVAHLLRASWFFKVVVVFSTHVQLEAFFVFQDFVTQLRPKVRAKLQRKRETKQVSALHLKNGEKSSEDNVELPYEFLKKANST